ncbi:MAG: Rieske 2Fe-2S domain-containing protein [Anaerolineales bacterium]|nr:Rieske 2Fe-2S domain-containing protein [Anaerolineales bacterium]
MAQRKRFLDEKPSVSRRGILKFFNRVLVATGIAALVGPIAAFFWTPKLEDMPAEPKAVGAADTFPKGKAVTIPFGRYPALVLHVPKMGVVAYSAVCTHFACIVKWNPESGMIECPCHEGYFDPQDGSVISGPPPEALTPIRVFTEDNTLFIGGGA